MNVDQLKQWADEMSTSLADSLMVSPETYGVIRTWAQKALLKHAVKNLHGTKVKYYQEYPEYYQVEPGNRYDMDKLPQWAQDALRRGDELVVVQPWKVGIAYGDIGREISRVRDYLRYKYQQDPRMFTPNRLARIPWTEAVRLTQEYHAELERKRPRSVNDMLMWYKENPEAVEQALAIMPQGRYAEIFKNSLAVRSFDYTYKNMVDTFGRPVFDKITKIYKKATGFDVALPKDDPKGRKPYIHYDDSGAITTPEPPDPPKKPDPTLHMDWGDEDQDGALEPEKEDFQPVSKFGPGWYKLTTDACVEYEGAMMGHCVGGYGHQVESGTVEIYSLRDKNNEPHVTIEVEPHSEWDSLGVGLQQVKGKENNPPVLKYREQVIDFLRKLYLENNNEIEVDDEASRDLLGLSVITGINDGLEVIDPPFDPYGFRYAWVVNHFEKDEDTGEEELDFSETVEYEEGLSFLDALDKAGIDITDAEDVLRHFMSGEPNYKPEGYGVVKEEFTIGYKTEEEKGYNLKPRKIARIIGDS